MTEIILALIVAVLLGVTVYERREHSKQSKESNSSHENQVKEITKENSAHIRELTSKVMAKNLNEFVLSESKKPLDFDKLSKINAAKESDLVDIDELSDEDAKKAIIKTTANLRKVKK